MTVTETSKVTVDHEEIEAWALARGGEPVLKEGKLAIRFPGEAQEAKALSWKDFFLRFEEEGLAFAYEEDKASRFYSFADRLGLDARAERQKIY
jgi:hypothetical protein